MNTEQFEFTSLAPNGGEGGSQPTLSSAGAKRVGGQETVNGEYHG
jgi:hypothetical protein